MPRAPLCGLLVAVLVAGGCSRATKALPLTVAVRDRITQQPVAGAAVAARTVHFFLPSAYFFAADLPLMGRDPILAGDPPPSARGATGDDGTVRLRVAARHPVEIMVLAPGYAPLTVDLPRHPAVSGEAGPWTAVGADAERQPARLEVRFLP